MPVIDTLISAVTTQSKLAHGRIGGSGFAKLNIPVSALVHARQPGQKAKKSPVWSQADDDFLRANLSYLSEAEIASQLARTTTAVRLRWKRDLHLPAPSKRHNEYTGNQVAKMLGTDIHQICKLMDRGLMDYRILPGGRRIRSVTRLQLYRFALNPEHWMMFHSERIQDQRLRKLVLRKQAMWGDEWWRIGDVARYHGVDHRCANNAIRKGKLPAVDWGNWWVRRSDALTVRLIPGKGVWKKDFTVWSLGAEGFIILARAVGVTWFDLGALMKINPKALMHHMRVMHRAGRIPALIKQAQLQVKYNPRTGALFADWRTYAKRFPALSKLLKRFKKNAQTISANDLIRVWSVLKVWADWHLPKRSPLRRTLVGCGRRTIHSLNHINRQLKADGVKAL